MPFYCNILHLNTTAIFQGEEHASKGVVGKLLIYIHMCVYMCICVCINVYIMCVYIHIYIYVYIHTYRDRETERKRNTIQELKAEMSFS